MRRWKFIHILLFPFLILIALSMLAVAFYASREYRMAYMREARGDLQEIASLTANTIRKRGLLDKPQELSEYCEEISTDMGCRVTIVAMDGLVIEDSDKDSELMKNHGTRVEVQQAYVGKVGYDIHFSKELQKEMMYCAVPIGPANAVKGVVRISFVLSDIRKELSAFFREVMLVAGITMVLAGMIALFVTRYICKPLEAIRAGAIHYASGDFSRRIPSSQVEELGLAVDTMNRMAFELSSRIELIEHEREEKEAVLASMSEGVLALDGEDRILYLNRAMSTILGVRVQNVIGRFLHEVIRVPEIQRIVEKRLKDSGMVEEEVMLMTPTEKRMQVHAVPMYGRNGHGSLLVFNDITRLSRLERTRQDFVANVSHELRTPITSILGFVETLLEGGALSDERDQRFMGIIKSQTERMVSIIDDLLLLSRLDSGSASQMPVDDFPAQAALTSAMESCAAEARKKNIRLEGDCPKDLRIHGNSHLLEQALINLISNAVRYSNSGGMVVIAAVRKDDEIRLSVTDNGRGIAEVDIPRIFERFYRVDKARSRQAGGTGLGLSIVKHIALVHDGRVEVSSRLGDGSVFTIVLPDKLSSC